MIKKRKGWRKWIGAYTQEYGSTEWLEAVGHAGSNPAPFPKLKTYD